ncbi:MAG: hypothetical protein Q7U05_04455 [Polaromonas sp.]|nr:hypothetical protein [Polaromonas sp.]
MINLLKSNYLLSALTLFLLSPATQASTWFALEAVESINGITVEVDLESLRSLGEKRELMTRITFSQPQKEQDISYQSVIAELEISCNSESDFWRSIRFFLGSSAEGKQLSSANFGASGLPRSVLMILPEKIWVTLQRSACGRAATAAH